MQVLVIVGVVVVGASAYLCSTGSSSGDDDGSARNPVLGNCIVAAAQV